MAGGPHGKTADAVASLRSFSAALNTPDVGKALAPFRLTYNERTMAIPHRVGAREISASPGKPRRVLAVDYGRKRIGLALSDALGLTAQPLATLNRVNRQNDLRRLREACRTHGVTHIIVGHPLHMTGEAGEMASEAARFAARLEKEIGIQVELVDERLTSWEAAETVRETKSSARRRRRPLDGVAAAVLLRDYLERVRGVAQDAAAEKA